MKYVGFDWASQGHDVTVMDETGRVLDRWAFPHSEAGWVMTLDRLRRQGPQDDAPVIIERTGGLVVDRLLAAGHPVVPVHPTAFFAARPRWGASGAKSDPGDSYKLADYLRTDGHRLRRLRPIDPGLHELQALVRLRDDQVRARTAASNQLTALLDTYWPGPRRRPHRSSARDPGGFTSASPVVSPERFFLDRVWYQADTGEAVSLVDFPPKSGESGVVFQTT